jgi:UDPglucose 6-dehydrogenase
MAFKQTIGIVGQGFVGLALKKGFEKYFHIETYDKYKKEESSCTTIKELSKRANIIFVCVPTPMNKGGDCNLSIIKEVVNGINDADSGNIVVIKSTIPPGTTNKLNLACKNINIVFNPEFLTEANFIEDFKNQSKIIIGGPRDAATTVKKLYRKAFPATPLIKTDSKTAELVKYFTNCFLATKVSFSNEFRQICEKNDVDYDKVVECALYDKRLGKTHFSSPGPDGKYGFGGSCFPKDLNAMIKASESLDVDSKILKAVWEKNLEVRPEKDWEKLKGRAISEEKE